MSKLLILDGNAVLHRAYHAIPDLTNRKGEHTNAVYGFVSMLLNLINNLKPSHLVVTFDEKEKTFRMKDYKKYQAQRPEMDEWLSSQIGKTRDFLDAAKISWYSKGGYEADDVIATIVEKVDGSEIDEIVVVTGDRDLFQLINDKVKIYVPLRGMSQGKIYDKEEVIKDYDFTPSQVPDYKALVGDSSDNYPGVAGIGPKTAVELLRKFKNIEEIYSNLDKIDVKVRVKLEKGKKDAEFFKKIATVFSEVPIKFDLEKLNNWNLGSDDVIELFGEFGFKTLATRVIELGVNLKKQKQASLF